MKDERFKVDKVVEHYLTKELLEDLLAYHGRPVRWEEALCPGHAHGELHFIPTLSRAHCQLNHYNVIKDPVKAKVRA
jgi:hypothetical protein